MRKSLYEFCLERDEFHILAQWDKEKNGSLSPRDFSYGSKRRLWWRCEKGHSWQAPAYSRTGDKSGCPYCAGQKLASEEDSLEVRYPALAAQWHPKRNGDLKPRDVPAGSHRKVWWQCERGHEWQAQIKSRANGSNCPYCTNREVLVGENDLATTHPQLAAQWDFEKNVGLTPQDVVAGANRKVWWRCEKGHEWQARIYSRSGNQVGCPVCSGKKVIAGENDLASVFPQIAAQWHPTLNGTLTPKDVTSSSNRRVWWRCEKGHAYVMMVGQRTHRGTGCPYCSGRLVLPGFNDLATLEPVVAAQWHPTLNGTLTPEMVTVGSKKKVWWQCPEGHVWKALIYTRAGKQRSGCPVCAGKVNEAKQARYVELLLQKPK